MKPQEAKQAIEVRVTEEGKTLPPAAPCAEYRAEELFADIYQEYSGVVYRIAYRILKDPALAEDARQDTFLNVYRGLHFFRGDSKFSTWITRIAVNACLGILRRKKRHTTIELDGNPEIYNEVTALEDSSPYSTCSASESINRVRRALSDISNKHEMVVRLHDLEGHTIPEIAKRLQVPSGTVKSRLFYGRQELKDRLSHAPDANWSN